ncbi:MAG: 2-dehydro-3-deoxygalactonokinase [Pseudomonadota bacterium]
MNNLIAFDWGTTNVRAALLDEGKVVDERRGESGVGHLDAAGFNARFLELTADWPTTPAIACGMVGSRQGWREADYLPCPAATSDLANHLTVAGPLSIVPGVKVDTEDHRDVMRGEEVQVAGLLAARHGFEGTVVLPGTHSKWVRIGGGRIIDFRTYITGDLFAALTSHTILRHSTGEDGPVDDGTFAAAAREAIAGSGSLAGKLFGLRAATLLSGRTGSTNRERLSGLLIGQEIEGAARDGFDVEEVTIIGSGALTARYADALSAIGATCETIEGSGLVWPALHDIAFKAGLIGD